MEEETVETKSILMSSNVTLEVAEATSVLELRLTITGFEEWLISILKLYSSQNRRIRYIEFLKMYCHTILVHIPL
jgi:hypothetical protein